MRPDRKYAKSATALGVVLVLSACTPRTVNWHKANASPDETGSVLRQCSTYATREAEKNFARDQISSSGRLGEQSTYRKNMDAYQAKKDITSLLNRCMKQYGYSKGR